jgi:hypothetical protein
MIINLSPLSNKGRFFSTGVPVGESADVTNLIPDVASKLVIQKNSTIAIF